MTDQTFIKDDGEIGSQPVTWDGEPLYSPSTVKEGLFDADAFEQVPGQLAIDEDRKDLEYAIRTVRYIRDNDCDFLTVDTLLAYGVRGADVARAALVEVMGQGWIDR